MNENPYEELLGSRKRDGKEILSFKPRTMKARTEPSSGKTLSPGVFIKEESISSSKSTVSPSMFIKEEVTVSPSMFIKEEVIAVEGKSHVVDHCSHIIERKEEKQPVDVLKALETISLHLLNNKKFSKAMKLMLQLVESSLNQSNSAIFFLHLTFLMRNCPEDRDIAAPAYAQGYRDLISMYYGKIEFLQKENFYQLETFYILVCLRASFETDDPFLYNRLCTELKNFIMLISSSTIKSSGGGGGGSSSTESPNNLAIENTTSNIKSSGSSSSSSTSSTESPNDSAKENTTSSEDGSYLIAVEREKALLVCLEQSFKIYHWTWAKQPCDSVYTCSAERRLFFTDENRDSLDALTNIKIQVFIHMNMYMSISY
jgi:hypothetical protein